ncbi:MAG TPA: PQQ-dependent sugar dehydrogenase [Acidimicrobiales bacterium]|nr:PQQ-dependent sugar dehydrogenase [Acidimicrobiales bacterium]
MTRPLRVLVAAVLALAAGCGGDGGGDGGVAAPPPTTTAAPPATGPTGTTAAPAARPDLGAVAVRLQEVARPERPTAMAVRPGDDAIYVAEKSGRVRQVLRGQGGGQPSLAAGAVLDLSGQVSNGSEQGLLGLTFSPDGGKLYVNYTDTAGDTRVVEYAFAGGRADLGSRRQLLFVDQPFANHNGGEVAFGPDGKLYIGLGDGGSQRDPNNNGQNLGTLLGKILRIDPAPSGGAPYTVPPDNPFVGRSGARPEIFAYGLRNPWRFTWDRESRDLWIADVGQNRWEEIDFVPAGSPAGANFGWSLMDSRHPLKGDNPPGAILPIFEYDHGGGRCTVIGGYVYRGGAIPALRGAYLFADYCSGQVWALTQQGGRVTADRELDIGQRALIQSFGEDASGELYALTTTGLFRLVSR